ncbi:biotin-dependent carboxyltransferase family protein [Reichenbachiella sp. MALMAid0571]|uniref:5-oxoprolinase subunit C family protein n=1 Tax=Reichenbachiella sp. MALMAid0571 TaxID=3143939 RepID=UPI0032DF6D92
MSVIEVLSPGLYTTVQDRGRTRFRSFGIPVSGCMDQLSADLGNNLLDNDSNAPVLEITMMGPQLLFQDKANIVITGADLSARIDGKLLKTNTIVTINSGDVLSFGKLKYGCRTYLCIQNGFDVPAHFGSCSAYEKAQLGLPVLKKGMKLYYQNNSTPIFHQNSRIKPSNLLFEENTVDVVPGPEYHLMNEKLLSETFEITRDSNRMGYRLKGVLSYSHSGSILTSTVMPGTVQLPPSGDPVVLMKDCQTTGGYPRILQVTEMGINILAQKKPGDQIKFTLKTLPEGRQS